MNIAEIKVAIAGVKDTEELRELHSFINTCVRSKRDCVAIGIKKDLSVSCEEMTIEKAKEINAMGVFESKYGDKVKVYTIGSGEDIISREICGGPHVERTGILGHFKITKEESSSAGVRRIKAILE